ncbi:MAG: hypothetical protein JO143_14285, partial [Acetobacteraceae bacterium]|nr:hypothetical protein [Acetobacteraceae bacterium]
MREQQRQRAQRRDPGGVEGKQPMRDLRQRRPLPVWLALGERGGDAPLRQRQMTGEPRQQTFQLPLSDRIQHNPVRIFPQFIEFAREQQILRRAWPEQDVARRRQPASPERRPAKPAARGQVASRAADAIQDAGGRPM